MIIPPELAISSALTFGQVASRGASPTACFIAKASDANWERFQSSVFLGLRASGVFEDLFNVFINNQKPGWDGDAAEPVVQDTYLNAYRFLESLPLPSRHRRLVLSQMATLHLSGIKHLGTRFLSA